MNGFLNNEYLSGNNSMYKTSYVVKSYENKFITLYHQLNYQDVFNHIMAKCIKNNNFIIINSRKYYVGCIISDYTIDLLIAGNEILKFSNIKDYAITFPSFESLNKVINNTSEINSGKIPE